MNLGEKLVFGNDVIKDAVDAMNNAAQLIRERHPGADANEVEKFVKSQFSAMNADPSVVISAEAIARGYDEATTRQQAGNARMQANIAKLIFKGLNSKPPHQGMQYYELQSAFQNAIGKSLSGFVSEVEQVVAGLQQEGYINVKGTGSRMPLFVQGIDFDQWAKAMTGDGNSTGSVTNNTTTYNVSGQGARVNVNSTDNSNNIVGDGAKVDVQGQLANLRNAIDTASELSDVERQSAHQVVDAVQQEFQKESPVKAVVTALLNGLPKVGAMATISNAIHTWFL
ncbi:hypothetical protein [Burkholderia cenocepacia]|uniref:hypothetical protein n=1 Tax=Burkholderia cenocepacia TaxID=95486 RepID=UPI0028619F4A|nr:hypothetical protein [Burkholderia cenocepacia]MDR8032099.1 hypothetical protein [Burkholderia cenocepacia]